VTDFAKLHGSMDSVTEKSQFNSSVEDNHSSYDAYEARNPNMTSPLDVSALITIVTVDGVKVWY
jgi:hypothetical protein